MVYWQCLGLQNRRSGFDSYTTCHACGRRLMVRTQDFQSCNGGSIPLGHSLNVDVGVVVASKTVILKGWVQIPYIKPLSSSFPNIYSITRRGIIVWRITASRACILHWINVTFSPIPITFVFIITSIITMLKIV